MKIRLPTFSFSLQNHRGLSMPSLAGANTDIWLASVLLEIHWPELDPMPAWLRFQVRNCCLSRLYINFCKLSCLFKIQCYIHDMHNYKGLSCLWGTVEPVLKDHTSGLTNVVSQVRWSLVTGSVTLKCRTFCQDYLAFQDGWSVKRGFTVFLLPLAITTWSHLPLLVPVCPCHVSCPFCLKKYAGSIW